MHYIPAAVYLKQITVLVFPRSMPIITLHRRVLYILMYILYCGLNALSLIFTLFLFVLLFKYKIIDFVVYRSLTVVSKIVQSNFVLFTDYSLVTGVFYLVLSFKPKPLLLLFWKFLKWKFSFTAGVTGNVQGMERAYEALGLTLRNGEPRLQQFGKKHLVDYVFPFIP